MKINGEYPKFYMRVEGKRFAAISTTRRNVCYMFNNQTGTSTNCYFLFKEIGDCESNFLCTKNKVIYVEVPEETND